MLYKKMTECGEAFALVEIPRARIEGICKNKWVKIGWTRCTVKKIQVTRCYRCLGIGHMAPLCSLKCQ